MNSSDLDLDFQTSQPKEESKVKVDNVCSTEQVQVKVKPKINVRGLLKRKAEETKHEEVVKRNQTIMEEDEEEDSEHRREKLQSSAQRREQFEFSAFSSSSDSYKTDSNHDSDNAEDQDKDLDNGVDIAAAFSILTLGELDNRSSLSPQRVTDIVSLNKKPLQVV